MERDWVLVSKCENALNGTGLLVAELEGPANVAPLLEVAEEVLAVSAFTGVERVLADGVKRGEVVRALEPAEVEPLPVELARRLRRRWTGCRACSTCSGPTGTAARFRE